MCSPCRSTWLRSMVAEHGCGAWSRSMVAEQEARSPLTSKVFQLALTLPWGLAWDERRGGCWRLLGQLCVPANPQHKAEGGGDSWGNFVCWGKQSLLGDLWGWTPGRPSSTYLPSLCFLVPAPGCCPSSRHTEIWRDVPLMNRAVAVDASC